MDQSEAAKPPANGVTAGGLQLNLADDWRARLISPGEGHKAPKR